MIKCPIVKQIGIQRVLAVSTVNRHKTKVFAFFLIFGNLLYKISTLIVAAKCLRLFLLFFALLPVSWCQRAKVSVPFRRWRNEWATENNFRSVSESAIKMSS